RRTQLEFREIFLKEFGFDAVLPDSISLFLALWPRRVLPVDLNRAIAVERVLLLSQLLVLGDTVFHPLPEAGKDLARRTQIAPQNAVAESGGILVLEFVDILLREIELVVIQGRQIGLQKPSRHLLVEFLPSVVALLEPTRNGDGYLTRLDRTAGKQR